MYSLTDAYENGNGSTAMTIVMGVVASLLFTTGMFLIFTSHNNSQQENFQKAVAALQQNLSQSGESSNAALLSLEAALAAQEGVKAPPINIPNSFSLDSLSVKGKTNLQGPVNTGKDLNVSNDLNVGGNFNLNGDISASSLALSGGITAGSDVQVTGDTTLDGALEVTDVTQLDNGLTVTGDTTTGTLETTGDVTFGGNAEVTGDTTLDGNLETAGNTTLDGNLETVGTAQFDSGITGGLDVTGDTTFESDAEIYGTLTVDNTNSAANGLTVTGNGSFDSISTTGSGDIGSNLTVQGTTTLADTATLDNGATVTGGTTTDTLQVNSDTTLGLTDNTGQYLSGGSLQVYGDTTLGGAYTYTFGSELITTSDFTKAAWTSPGWTVTTSSATHQTGNTSALSTSQVTPTVNDTYQVSYTVSGNPATDSSLTANFGGQTVATSTFPGGTGGNGTVTNTITATSTAGLSFVPDSAFDGTVSAVSIKQVTSSTPASGTLEVTGSTTLDAGLTVTGATTTDTLESTGNTTVDGNLEAVGTAQFDSGVIGGLSVTGGTTTDTLESTGNTTVDGSFESVGGATLDSGLNVTGGTSTDSLNASSGATVGGGLNVTGGTKTDTLNIGSDYSLSEGSPALNIYYGTTKVAKIDSSGDLYIAGTLTQSASNFDYAERYASSQNLAPGTVVAIDPANPEQVVATTMADQASAIGVVSTNPAITIGGSSNTVVAEAGHVPVNVTDQNGPISPGDYLTPSGTPGYAMKANPGDKTIAQAMESFSGTSGQVNAFIEISNGGVTAASPDNIQSTQFSSINVSGPSTLSDLTVTGTASINNLTVAGTASVANLVISGHVTGNGDTRGTVTIPAGQTTVHYAFTAPYAQTPAVVASPENQPASFSVAPTTTGFNINLASPAASDIKFDYIVEQ